MRTNTTEQNADESLQLNGGAGSKVDTSTVNKNLMNSAN
jgi:hypothetical protein